MQLADLIAGCPDLRIDAGDAPARSAGDGKLEVSGLTADSRRVQPGFLFAALAGSRANGAAFIADALSKGAKAILAETGSKITVPPGITLLRSGEPRRALAVLAARYFGPQPSRIVAVTGTNGKTSIAEFTRQIFAACGHAAASLGTLGIVKPDGAVYGSLTTPDPVTLAATLSDLAREGVTHMALEASSHGLDQFRLDGVRLTAAAFNNLGRDHLDYHPTMEAYFDAKLRLFRELMFPGAPVVVNADGPGADEAMAVARARGLRLLTTGRKGETLRLVDVRPDGFRQRLTILHDGRTYDVTLPLIGEYQAGNALVAAALAMACGETAARSIAAIEGLEGVKGRLEVVGGVNGGIVVVDYAHKPEALASALAALRPFARRLVCVFGCGGDRDRGKRPIMGRIAVDGADAVIVTDDNPRTERPEVIRAEVLADAAGAREIGDRAEAIREGVTMLKPGDVLLVAGKGHETGQIVGSTVLPFSDHEVVRTVISEVEAHGRG
jgi:UDP-N-acetylmuramoyl-L-alanyl-D-glutamate--2,6-diaminopimelate ligase